jgi:hypothetical protein
MFKWKNNKYDSLYERKILLVVGRFFYKCNIDKGKY